MLTAISVDGFKSLKNFKLALHSGLNILIGPNGAGKTNIVSFFEFISYLTESNINEAILRAGGASAVFRKTNDETAKKKITFSLNGSYYLNPLRQQRTEFRQAKYQYYAEIDISDDNDEIYFSKQRFQLAFTNQSGSYKTSKKGKSMLWDLDVLQTSEGIYKSNLRVEKLDLRKIQPQIFTGGVNDKNFIIRLITRRFSNFSLSINCIFLGLSDVFPILRTIGREIYCGTAFNIAPSKTKEREDISTSTGVMSDGSGLSATLLHLKKLRDSSYATANRARVIVRNLPSRSLHVRRDTFDDIVELSRLVNQSIEDIDIKVDKLESFIRVIFKVKSDSGFIDIPFQNMSDGTAKWLALTTAVLTTRNIFAIEEPENFLHPYMQKQVLDVIRGSTAMAGKSDSFALITSHSETLLNAASPNEIIVVSMKDGATSAHRVQNVELLKEEISKSGFGLGWFYLAGALGDD